MDIRALLQTEIWSKRTSRKILRILGRILVVLGVAIVGIVAWGETEMHWLTSPERNAGKAALYQIDALQNFRGMSDKDYEVGLKQAEERVQSAESVEWTARDRTTVVLLSAYLEETNWDRKFWVKAANSENERIRHFALKDTGKLGRDTLRTSIEQWIGNRN